MEGSGDGGLTAVVGALFYWLRPQHNVEVVVVGNRSSAARRISRQRSETAGNNLCGDAQLQELRDQISLLNIEHAAIDNLCPSPRNARTHNEQQIVQIAASISAFGFLNPIIVDPEGQILAGHGRLAAAMRLGLTEVPIIRVDRLTDAHKRLFALADNRLAELAGWDEEVLSIELKELEEIVLDLDISITGFDTVDIDRIAESVSAKKIDPADLIPEMEAGPISKLGDVWRLGRHKLLCGSALDKSSYESLLGDERAQTIVTDPPYNVPIDGHVSGTGRREFVMASGEMSEDEFVKFLLTTFGHLAEFSDDGSIHFVAMDWRHMMEILAAAQPIYGKPKNLAVWVKDNGGMGSFYRSQHELIFVFKSGTGPHINNFGLGERGRYRTNVWHYPGVNSFRRGRDEELAMHPTVKPVAMLVDALKDCSKRGGIVLDPFAGSGSTIIAAERTHRVARALELDPLYVDVIIRRWEKFTKVPAVLDGDGRPFAEIAAIRTAAPVLIKR
jgi:DNA modification methylase